ncbi:MAG: HAD-IA family hydrolase [Eubacteriales bacterium]|nr:HAD-IA family hydrolase [Eubacteriales bacterium]
MKYQSILFDLDGTLVQSDPGIVNSVRVAFEKMNLPVPTTEELYQFIGPPSRVTFPKFGIPEDQVETAVKYYRTRYGEKGKYECNLYPGIVELLETLKERGYQLYVATSKPEQTSVDILEYLGIAKYFDVIAGASFDHSRDQKAQVLRYLFEKIPQESCVLIGDTIFDINGANEVGIPMIGVSWGYGNREEVLAAGALGMVGTTEELLEML